MNRKVFNYFTIIVMLVSSVGFNSCSSDDDEKSSEISYTSDEIVELLTGRWAIRGHIRITSMESNVVYADEDYTGTIEFEKNKKFTVSSSKITFYDNAEYYDLGGFYSEGLDRLIGRSSGYSILKKEGKSYITFNALERDFQIMTLSKNSFKFVYDETEVSVRGSIHYYVTIISN